MGTRADFYIGVGDTAEWLGSAGYDGHHNHIGVSGNGWVVNPVLSKVILATSEIEFRNAVKERLNRSENDGTFPNEGWPWPWEDSRTTDYAYTFHEGKVLMSKFGLPLIEVLPIDGNNPPDSYFDGPRKKLFPRFGGSKQNVSLGPNSGLMIFGIGRNR